MDIEQRQAELIDHFAKQAAVLEGAPLAGLVNEATAHPSLFAFSEVLSVPNLSRLEGGQYSSHLELLRLFAYGTCTDYKSTSGSLPALSADQVRKLKQLTVLTLAEANKVLPYDQLMQELDVSNVRELEDFLINDCMYAGIVRGKLDQLRRCFEVQFAAGRDLRPKQLNCMIHTLENWLTTSDNLLQTIQEKINWADAMSEANKKHRKEIEEKVEDAKKSFKADMDIRGHEEIFFESGGMMDYEEDRARPKRQNVRQVRSNERMRYEATRVGQLPCECSIPVHARKSSHVEWDLRDRMVEVVFIFLLYLSCGWFCVWVSVRRSLFLSYRPIRDAPYGFLRGV